MVKLETYRRKRSSPDMRKCALVAAVISAAIVFTVELTGGPVAPASARLGTPAPSATSTMPVSAPH